MFDLPFRSYFLGGFECSTHRRGDGRRLDVLRATEHDIHAGADYAQLQQHGIRAARDGVRWHLIAPEPGALDWTSLIQMAQAARATGMQVIWDLCHYGWPDHVDVWSPEFVEQFASFATATAVFLAEVTGEAPWFCPINEISFLAWAGGEVGRFPPHATGRGAALKRQLAAACIAATRAIRDEIADACFITAEPLIRVQSATPDGYADAAAYTLSQYEALDMVLGRLAPELGGAPDLIDVLGVNYYPDNQWYLGADTIHFGHHAYVPLRDLLAETSARYGKPLFISETGAEGSARSAWLHYVCEEAEMARQTGAGVVGVCLYPILDYPGWENDRPCRVGLLGSNGPSSGRALHGPLAHELQRQTRLHAARARAAVGTKLAV